MWSPLTPLPRRHQGPYVWLWNDVCAHYFLLSLLVPYLDKCIALNLSLCPQVPCCPFPSQNDPPPNTHKMWSCHSSKVKLFMVSHRLKVRAWLRFPFRVFHSLAGWHPSLKRSAFLCMPGKWYQMKSFQKLPLICLWALGPWLLPVMRVPGSMSLCPPSSVGGYPTRHLGHSSLAPQDVAQCPLYSGCVNWTKCIGVTCGFFISKFNCWWNAFAIVI